MSFELPFAIEVLDALAAGIAPSRGALLHSALALALRGRREDEDVVAMVMKLEQLALGQHDALDEATEVRAGRLAARLRHWKPE
jgi:hypothetical protein